MDNIKKFKFKIIKNFLTKNELNIFENYCKIRHRLNDSEFTNDILTWDTSIYGDPLMEALLLNKKTKMEELTGLSLLPTYAYWRMYTKYADLTSHKDRESCEISATLNIGSDGTPWAFFIENQRILLNPGDCAIYLGCELTHWREEFMGDWCAQTFLHYVDANGPYTNHEKDKRKLWGNKEGQRQ
tara:strand:- start:3033 stop:3587 length:555 start_codon:yes stop_codon:yes gene_type:complete